MLHQREEDAPSKTVKLESISDSSTAPAAEIFELIGTCMAFAPNSEIFAEGERSEYLYKVVSGAVRTCRLTTDGRRHIGAFYLPGDVFGLEASEVHRFSAEALRNCTVGVVRKNRYWARAADDSEIIANMWEHTARHLERAQNHMFLLGRKSAQERIAAFLLEMAERLPTQDAVELPMSRQDIADYLGLTIETVSRILTQMARDSVVGIPVSRRIVLRDRGALVQMNDCMGRTKRLLAN